MKYKKIIIIDDCPKVLAFARQVLNDFSKLHVLTYEDEFEGLRAIIEERPDLILLDIKLKTITGHYLGGLLKKLAVPSSVIYMSESIKELSQTPMSIAKPFTKDALKNCVKNILVNDTQNLVT